MKPQENSPTHETTPPAEATNNTVEMKEKGNLTEKIDTFFRGIDKRIEDKVYDFCNSFEGDKEKSAQMFKTIAAWGSGFNSALTLHSATSGNTEVAVLSGIWAFGLAGATRYFGKAAERLNSERTEQ